MKPPKFFLRIAIETNLSGLDQHVATWTSDIHDTGDIHDLFAAVKDRWGKAEDRSELQDK